MLRHLVWTCSKRSSRIDEIAPEQFALSSCEYRVDLSVPPDHRYPPIGFRNFSLITCKLHLLPLVTKAEHLIRRVAMVCYNGFNDSYRRRQLRVIQNS